MAENPTKTKTVKNTEETKHETEQEAAVRQYREMVQEKTDQRLTQQAGTFFMCPVYPTAVGQDMMRVATANGISAPCQVLAIGVYMSVGQVRPSVKDTYMLVAITIPEWHPAINLFNDKEAAAIRAGELKAQLQNSR